MFYTMLYILYIPIVSPLFQHISVACWSPLPWLDPTCGSPSPGGPIKPLPENHGDHWENHGKTTLGKPWEKWENYEKTIENISRAPTVKTWVTGNRLSCRRCRCEKISLGKLDAQFTREKMWKDVKRCEQLQLIQIMEKNPCTNTTWCIVGRPTAGAHWPPARPGDLCQKRAAKIDICRAPKT